MYLPTSLTLVNAQHFPSRNTAENPKLCTGDHIISRQYNMPGGTISWAVLVKADDATHALSPAALPCCPLRYSSYFEMILRARRLVSSLLTS